MGDRVWNTAIWHKTWGDQRGLVLALVALWGVFPWLFLWLSSQIQMNAFQDVLLQAIPKDWQRLSGVPFSDVATHAGRVALAFVDPVVVLAATVTAPIPMVRRVVTAAIRAPQGAAALAARPVVAPAMRDRPVLTAPAAPRSRRVVTVELAGPVRIQPTC